MKGIIFIDYLHLLNTILLYTYLLNIHMCIVYNKFIFRSLSQFETENLYFYKSHIELYKVMNKHLKLIFLYLLLK